VQVNYCKIRGFCSNFKIYKRHLGIRIFSAHNLIGCLARVVAFHLGPDISEATGGAEEFTFPA
jgi:hypothetical protein